MKNNLENGPVGHGWKLLGLKVLLGALAALVAMALMRVVGGGEALVAVFIGLVPGVAEKSPKKIAAGAVLGLAGYFIGAQVGLAISRRAQGVPLGHWAVVGGCIGLTSGLARHPNQSSSSRIAGAITGVIFGLVFGIMGDIGGFLTVPANALPLFYYLREVSLTCAGLFINLGAGLAAMIAAAVGKRAFRKLQLAEGAQA